MAINYPTFQSDPIVNSVTASTGVSGSLATFNTITGSHSGALGLFTSLTSSGVSSSGDIYVGQNLGVGLSNPSLKLHVSSSTPEIARFESNASLNDAFIRVRESATEDVTLGTFFGNAFVGSSTATSMSIRTNNTDRIRVDPSGNVGVGQLNPSFKFDVNGTGRFSDDVEISGNTIISDNSANPALRITQTGAGLALRVEDEANPDSTPFVVDATGKVGIGVASPDEELVVSGNQAGTVTARIRNENSGSDSYSALIFGNDTSANKLLVFANSSNRGAAGQGGAGNSVIRTDSGKLIFGAAGSVSHVVDTNGNFGIGTLTASSYKLEVNGTISGSAVYGLSGASAQFPNFTNDVRNQLTGSTYIDYNKSTGVISYTGGGGGTVNSGNAGYVAYYPSPGGTTIDDSGIYWDNATGFVGIGTVPSSRFHLGGETAQFPSAIYIAPTAHATSRRAGAQFGDWVFGQDASGNGNKDFFFFNGLNRLFISASGDIGIGTPTPAYKLDVNGTGRYVSTLTVSGGIAFPAAQAASSDPNTLDDYEEGTWTPALSASTTNNFTHNTTLQSGSYVKIGKKMILNGVVAITATGSSAGNLFITGLPVAIANTNNDWNSMKVGYYKNFATTATSPIGLGVTGSATIQLYKSGAGSGSIMTVTDLTTTSELYFRIDYNI